MEEDGMGVLLLLLVVVMVVVEVLSSSRSLSSLAADRPDSNRRMISGLEVEKFSWKLVGWELKAKSTRTPRGMYDALLAHHQIVRF